MSTSPHSILVDQKRAEAALARRPLLRLAGPAIIPTVAPTDQADTVDGAQVRNSALVINYHAGKLTAFTAEGEKKISSGMIVEHVEKLGRSIVAVDKQSLNALFRRLERLGDPVARSVSYQLRAASRLPSSTQLTVLTAACNRKFWAPTKMDVGSIAAWRDALGAKRGAVGYLEMIQMAASSEIDGAKAAKAAPPVLRNATVELRRSSLIVFKRASSGSDDAAIESYLAAEKANEAWSALRAYDPIARHEVATEGSSALIEPFGRDAGTSHILAVVSQPCRIKTGRTVELLSTTGDAKVGAAELVRLSYDPNRGLIGEFRPAPSPTKGKVMTQSFTPLESGIATHETFIMAPKPFLGSAKGFASRANYWASTTAANALPITGRDVPVDVAFAGGVT